MTYRTFAARALGRIPVVPLLLLLGLFLLLRLPADLCVQVPGWTFLPLAVRQFILTAAGFLSVAIGGFESC